MVPPTEQQAVDERVWVVRSRVDMEICEAKAFKDTTARLTWTNRQGAELSEVVYIAEVVFVPLYGPCLRTSVGEIRVDRVVSCEAAALRAA